jgi:CubicO group peptidase (beta-lactamase class C family)
MSVCLLPSTIVALAPLPEATPAVAGFCEERLNGLHDKLGGLVDRGDYSGYVLMLLRDGHVVDWRAHGYQDVEAGVPMQRDSIVRIYSMSKIITSVAALMLVERGELRLSDTVETYIPELAKRKVWVGGSVEQPELVDALRPFTVHDLLTHTAGYYYDAEWSAAAIPAEWMRRQNLFQSKDADDFVKRVAAVPLHEQPGTRFRYGINTDLLGIVVERVSGQSLEDFLQENLLKPLKMEDTSFDVPTEKLSRRAAVHGRAGGKLQVDVGMDWRDRGGSTFCSGGGGLYSTAADYARFAQMLLNGGELEGTRILSPKTVELMTSNRIAHLADPHPFGLVSHGFGLGVRVLTDLGRSATLGSPGMFGWDGAATTQVVMDPSERLVSILLLQHVPFNEGDVFSYWMNGVYGALVGNAGPGYPCGADCPCGPSCACASAVTE